MSSPQRPNRPGVGDIITTAAQLDALPVESIVLFPPRHDSLWGYIPAIAVQKHEAPDNDGHVWYASGGDDEGRQSSQFFNRDSTPATVLHIPGHQPDADGTEATSEDAAREWLANYHGSIDAAALILAHQAGQRHATAENGASS